MTIPQSHVDLLDSTAVAHVATIGPEGEPQSTPVWFDFDGALVCFSQTTSRQKYRNLLRNPRIALSITDPTNPYRYLEIRGEVIEISNDDGNTFVDSLAKKYLGRDSYPWHQPGDHRVVVRVKPVKTTHGG